MAKYISLKFEPESGTAFDYLVNVDNVFLVQTSGQFLFSNGLGQSGFPIELGLGNEDTSAILMAKYVNDLILAARERGGNDYFVPSTESPFTITEFT